MERKTRRSRVLNRTQCSTGSWPLASVQCSSIALVWNVLSRFIKNYIVDNVKRMTIYLGNSAPLPVSHMHRQRDQTHAVSALSCGHPSCLSRFDHSCFGAERVPMAGNGILISVCSGGKSIFKGNAHRTEQHSFSRRVCEYGAARKVRRGGGLAGGKHKGKTQTGYG